MMVRWNRFLALLGRGTANQKPVSNQVINGPLTIRYVVEQTNSQAWYNLGTRPGSKINTSFFSVHHYGKTIVVDTTGGAVTEFCQALFLTDAPRPAVLVATHSVYLITEESGRAAVKPIDVQEGDFARFQWLDSDNGQPKEQQEAFPSDNAQSSRFLSGGRYLLVNTRTVLDIQTFAIYTIDTNSPAFIKNWMVTIHSIRTWWPCRPKRRNLS